MWDITETILLWRTESNQNTADKNGVPADGIHRFHIMVSLESVFLFLLSAVVKAASASLSASVCRGCVDNKTDQKDNNCASKAEDDNN